MKMKFSIIKLLTKKTILQFSILFIPGVTLLMSFQNCAPVQFESISDVNSLSSGDENEEANPGVCASGESEKCRVENGDGVKECKPNLSGFDECRLISCDVGFKLQDSHCLPSDCSNGAINAPNCNDCGAAGVMLADRCVVKQCEANQIHENCLVVENGRSSKVCNNQGTAFGVCNIVCNEGYQLVGNKCIAKPCTNGALTAPECIDCSADRYFDDINKVCVAKVCTPQADQECQIAGGIGSQICNEQGAEYGPCILVECDNNHTRSDDLCIPKICSNGATNFPDCNSCQSGQSYNGASCVAQTCSPNSTKSCLIQNGTGIQTCNAQGSAYGAVILNLVTQDLSTMVALA